MTAAARRSRAPLRRIAIPLIAAAICAFSADPARDAEPAHSAAARPAPATIRALAHPARVAAGGTITVEISARGLKDAGGAAFHLVFDPSFMEPLPAGALEGALLRQGGAATSFMAQPASTGDRVIVGLTRLGARRGVHGGGVLCRIAFRALRPGATAVAFDRAHLMGPDASDREARFQPARIIIDGRPPAPREKEAAP